jgi:Protein of unknown function (DUF3618)
MSSSAQLEYEAEQTRSHLTDTLDELRERITPGQLVDQCVDFAIDSGGGEFVRNLGREIAQNPLPVCLMGAGIGWLMMSGSGSVSSAGARPRIKPFARDAGGALGATQSATEGISSAAQQARDGTAELASDVGDRIANAADSASRRIQETSNSVGEATADLKGRMSDTVSHLSERTSSAYGVTARRAAAATGALSDTLSSGYDSMAEDREPDRLAPGARCLVARKTDGRCKPEPVAVLHGAALGPRRDRTCGRSGARRFAPRHRGRKSANGREQRPSEGARSRIRGGSVRERQGRKGKRYRGGAERAS